jgi:hypothetical protein
LPPKTRTDSGGVSAVYEAKVRAELKQADKLAPGSDVVASTGPLFAELVLLKGLPGPAEASGGPALSGADGEAARKALEALALASEPFAALTRPEPQVAPRERSARVRRIVEAVDPTVVLALDAEAAEDLGAAFGVGRLAYGRAVGACGRTLLAVDGLEASLADPVRKRRVWRQMRPLADRRALI